MEFINQAVTVLQTSLSPLALVLPCGAWSTSWRGTAMTIPVPRAKESRQLMAGGGVVLIGTTLIPLLSGLF